MFAWACATAPIVPDATVHLSGKWKIVAVDDRRTGGGRNFNFELKPGYGLAQFGCNIGSGTYAIQNGWLVGGDRWIITAASCLNRDDWLEFERKGFHILSRPLAIERVGGRGVRLRNELGSIDLRPALGADPHRSSH